MCGNYNCLVKTIGLMSFSLFNNVHNFFNFHIKTTDARPKYTVIEMAMC